MKLNDKVVLITGAGRGLGAATARAFAREGAVVIVNYLQNTQAAEQVVADCKQAGGQAWAMQADVTDAVAVQDMVSEIVLETGRIDVLVNNAFAPYRFDPDTRLRFTQLGWEACQRQFEGAVKSAWQTSQAVVPHMQRQAGGSIINISTDLTEQAVVPYPDYATGKAALQGLSRQMAADLGQYGIRVNCVAPGLVWPTDASRDTRASIRQQIIAQTPLRRVATPEDITGPILFLASAYSQFMTGQVIYVDGGLLMR
ncbi:SDR family oxidoreductase [Pusillimonas sp. TS35]|uniref:SDR family oxidoreductase n=1 Tax=Paracandidimonas lactea TaxID=2895524 RepID=UPI001368362B|nr:SDR family oxidoreductase [Paracandidimonas lactea]MYN13624.1 SDR family oxidoreductase [Pusillimonas sp. TS35]